MAGERQDVAGLYWVSTDHLIVERMDHMHQIRLVYRSTNAMRMPAQRMLIHFNDIVTTARANNPRLGVCGFLMFDHRRFHQVLEGAEKAVHDLYDCIRRDVRHTDVTLLASTPIAQPFFSDWSMASFLGDDITHPLQIKHGITHDMEIPADTFTRFAMDFVAQEAASDA
jgi:Sensors of blue-light using FAD